VSGALDEFLCDSLLTSLPAKQAGMGQENEM